MRRMPLNGADIEKFTFISGSFSFDNEILENASKTAPYNKLIQALINTEETEDKSRGIILFDYDLPMYYIGYMEYDSDVYLFNVKQATIRYCHINYDNELDKMTINIVDEALLSTDDIKTIFGKSITGTGNIELYRHQMTITNANDVSVVYIVNSANNLKVNSAEKFVTITKADTIYIGLASYLDASGNVQPAFIRYSDGKVIVQLQNGSISPMKRISDVVTSISL